MSLYDPRGGRSFLSYVRRGGSHFSRGDYARWMCRFEDRPSLGVAGLGLRIARSCL